jgi:hypothetical protein
MGDILTDYTGIRDLLGEDTTTLPNAVIDEDPYLPYVEAQVKARISGYATLTGANLVRLKTAVAAWTAARLAGGALATGDVTSLRLADYQYQVSLGGVEGWRQRVAELMEFAVSSLAGITTRTWTPPTALVIAQVVDEDEDGA